MGYRVKHILEYAALRGVCGVLNALPYRAALALVWPFAWLAFHVFRFFRREVFLRIKEVFGDEIPDARIRRIAWLSLRNTFFSAVEMVRLAKIDQAWLDRHTSITSETVAPILRENEKGNGGIIAAAHMGSWELAGVGSKLRGVPLFTFYARQTNPLVNRWMEQLRLAPGMVALERGSVNLRDIIRRLKRGEVLAILTDLRKPTPGVEVDFLGGVANVGGGMAMFARTSNVPIFPTLVRRVGWTHHEMVVGDPIWPDTALTKKDDMVRMTRLVLEKIDARIHEQPEQWFWYNRRWILDPPGTPLRRKR